MASARPCSCLGETIGLSGAFGDALGDVLRDAFGPEQWRLDDASGTLPGDDGRFSPASCSIGYIMGDLQSEESGS